jgi:hypothetical protein
LILLLEQPLVNNIPNNIGGETDLLRILVEIVEVFYVTEDFAYKFREPAEGSFDAG